MFFSDTFIKGDNFSESLLAVLDEEILTGGIVLLRSALKEKNLLLLEQILSDKSLPQQRRVTK